MTFVDACSHVHWIWWFTWSPTVECSHSNSIAVEFGNQLAAACFIHQLQFSKKSVVFYKSVWAWVVLSRQGSILSKNQCQGQNFMACTNLHGDMGAVQKSVPGLNPGGKSSHLLLRLIIVKMLLLKMHSTINLLSCYMTTCSVELFFAQFINSYC